MGKNILCLTADPDTRTDSFSSSMTRAFLDELRTNQPDSEITELDVYQMDLPVLNSNTIKKLKSREKETNRNFLLESNKEISLVNELFDQLMDADAYVFISRTIGFGLPAQLKSLVEMLAIANNTRIAIEDQRKKGLHIQIEDDMLAPILQDDDKNTFTTFLADWSVDMMETLILTHEHHKNSGDRNNMLFKAITDTRKAAQEYANFLFR